MFSDCIRSVILQIAFFECLNHCFLVKSTGNPGFSHEAVGVSYDFREKIGGRGPAPQALRSLHKDGGAAEGCGLGKNTNPAGYHNVQHKT